VITRSDLDMLVYFWEEKDDVTRCVDWERMQPELQEKYPEIIKAWTDHQTSRRTLTAVLRHARDYSASGEPDGR
jgi:hypothetical protein